MKTLDEMYNEIISDEELKKTFVQARKDGKVTELLKAHGCEATEQEVDEFLEKRSVTELSDEELDNAAGGCGGTITCGYCGQPVDRYHATQGMHSECYKKYLELNKPKEHHLL